MSAGATARIRLQCCGRFHSDGTFTPGCEHDPKVDGSRDVRGAGEYESSFAFAFDAGSLADARQIAHDQVVHSTGRARRSGVVWTHHAATDALYDLRDYGINVMPELVDLCRRYPTGIVVMATVAVDESVAP